MSGGGLEGLGWMLSQAAAKGLAEAGQKLVQSKSGNKAVVKSEPKK